MSRRALLVTIAVVVAFAAGIGFGEALDDGTGAGGTQTLVRTLRPLGLVPARQTVTVTVTTTGG